MPEHVVRDLQRERVGPVFQRLRDVLDAGSDSLTLRSDPTAIAPESLLVFEVSSPLADFGRAAASVPGLEFVAEEALDEADADQEGGAFYLLVPDQRALDQIERLWSLWDTDQDLGAFSAFGKVFACLRAVRRWNAQDRVTDADAAVLRELAALEPDRPLNVEIELVFRADLGASDRQEAEVLEAVLRLGGRLLDRARHPSFASHAMLVALPAAEVAAIAGRAPDSLAALHPILAIGPQASIDVDADPEEGVVPIPSGQALPAGESVAAMVDAVPMQGHRLLAGQLDIDDPEDLESLSVGFRAHGTAMASLIVHGDLNEHGQAIGRPLHVRPMLYAPFARSAREVFRSDRLVVDSFHDAITRMKVGLDGVPPTAPGVIVVNVSVGDSRRRFSRRMSRWARAMDDLASRLGILFIVSAGNLDVAGVDDVDLPGVADLQALEGTGPEARTAVVLQGLRDRLRDRSLLAPAEAINALTVGSGHVDAVRPRPGDNGPSLDPYPEAILPNVSSAPGPGFGRAVKPEILMPGGRERITPVLRPDGGLAARPRPPSALAGLRVASPSTTAGTTDATSFTGQTSAAAALATRTAHRIHDALEEAYGSAFTGLAGRSRALLLKASLVHRARWSAVGERIVEIFSPGAHWETRRRNVSRLLGYGTFDPDEAVHCAYNRATAWAVGSLGREAAATFAFPLPPSLAAVGVTPHAMTVTLAWFSPISPGRNAYRQVRLSVVDPVDEQLGLLGMGKGKAQPSLNAIGKGTIVHRQFSGAKAASVGDDDALSVTIQRERDPGPRIDGAVDFALVVTLETDAELPIYDEVLQRVAVKPRVRV